MDARYYTLDVFTEDRFAGNPLAVFPDATRIPEPLLPKIAAELGLSETVFVYPPSAGGLRRLRIFTPGEELPFAGHPTIGTAWLLAALGELKVPEGRGEAVLEEGVGPIPVVVRELANGGFDVQCTAARAPERLGDGPVEDLVLAALGLESGDLGQDAYGVWSAGVPFLVVPLASVDALRRTRVGTTRLARALAGTGAHAVSCIVVDGPADAPVVRTRMFAPAIGVPEDPATGAAAVAFAGLLATRQGVTTDGTLTVRVDQGIEMGRPSRLELAIEIEAGAVRAVHLGGRAVLVASAALRLG